MSSEWRGQLKNIDSKSGTAWRLDRGWIDIENIEIDDETGAVLQFFLPGKYNSAGGHYASRKEVNLLASNTELGLSAGVGAGAFGVIGALTGGAIVFPAILGAAYYAAFTAWNERGGPRRRFRSGYYIADDGEMIRLKTGILRRNSADLYLGT